MSASDSKVCVPHPGETWCHPRGGFVRVLEVDAERALILGMYVGARRRWRPLHDFGREAGAIQPLQGRA